MARACPSCGRPNGDAAVRCLYCVASLPPVEVPTPLPVEAPSPGAPAGKAWHLLILLPGEAKEEAIEALSRIASLSAYDARMSFSTSRPRLFRRIESEPSARRLSEALASARIPHYVAAESSVTSLPVGRAIAIELGDRHFEPILDGAFPRVGPASYEDLLLLVRGEITRERHHEKRIGSTKGASRRLTPGLRLHLYTRDAGVAIEVDPDLFDFRLPHEEQTASALLNFERLIGRIVEKAPGLSVDRGFAQEPQVLSRAGGGDVTAALVASDRGDQGPAGVPYDDEANFRFYARWRYRVARHLARRGSA